MNNKTLLKRLKLLKDKFGIFIACYNLIVEFYQSKTYLNAYFKKIYILTTYNSSIEFYPS